MSDMSENVSGKVISNLDPFKKILNHIPGFKGYIKRQSRRDSDKILRETVANRFEEQWQRISRLQREFIKEGEISQIDDLEVAAINIRTFIDRIRRAPRGYSGIFDAVKINEKELDKIYAYDSKMFDLVNEVGRAVDNIETSVGSDGLPAAIRHLISMAQQCVEVYNRRSEAVFGTTED